MVSFDATQPDEILIRFTMALMVASRFCTSCSSRSILALFRSFRAVVYQLIWPFLVGASDVPDCGSPASSSVHLASSAVTPMGSVHKSRGDNVVRMWLQLKRWCVSCVWMSQRGHSGDGCVLASTLCKMIWGREICFFWVGLWCDEWGGEVSLQSC